MPSGPGASHQGADEKQLITHISRHNSGANTSSPPSQEKDPNDAILSLARNFTSRSHHSSPFDAPSDSPLDPSSPSFDARVSGTGSPTDFQSSVANSLLKLPALFGRGAQKIHILRELDGLVLPGEQCCVLGPPGSGCSTLLKTVAGETHGFEVGPESYVNYQGIRAERMHGEFRGEAIYTAEVDRHFAQLGVGDTLYFAA